MFEKLNAFLATYANFSEQDLGKIQKCFTQKIVDRNDLLLREGEVCKAFYYVCSGCLRTYFITSEGNEKTRSVIVDNETGTALTSFINQKPSFEFIEALENTEVLVISYKDFYMLTAGIAEWKEFYLQILENAYLQQSRKVEALMKLNAKERYQKLLKGNPMLIRKLSNKVLASFLGMREETLSRIKSK